MQWKSKGINEDLSIHVIEVHQVESISIPFNVGKLSMVYPPNLITQEHCDAAGFGNLEPIFLQ